MSASGGGEALRLKPFSGPVGTTAVGWGFDGLEG